jgi:predicted hotdog family 3-hydroxylacyl-ACP dehydratase
MCLLDEVLSWDPLSIRCRSSTHRAVDNPLRAHGRLGAACGIEYAAQAMAIHGALIASTASAEPTTGYLASVRNVLLHVTRLDDLEPDLVASAQRIAGDRHTVLYDFQLSSGERLLVSERASIVFEIER